jgi:hypothetical protein
MVSDGLEGFKETVELDRLKQDVGTDLRKASMEIQMESIIKYYKPWRGA